MLNPGVLLLSLGLSTNAAAVVIESPQAGLRSESLAFCGGEDPPNSDFEFVDEAVDWQFETYLETSMDSACGGAVGLASLNYQTLTSVVETNIELTSHVSNLIAENEACAGFSSNRSRMTFDIVLTDTRDVKVRGTMTTSGPDSGQGASCYLSFKDIADMSSNDFQSLAVEGRLGPGTYPVFVECSGNVVRRYIGSTWIGGGLTWASAMFDITLTKVDTVTTESVSFGTLKSRFR